MSGHGAANEVATDELPVVPIGRSGYNNFGDDIVIIHTCLPPTALLPADVEYPNVGQCVPPTPTEPLQPTLEANALEAELRHMR